ncbi:uncharacterized protein [Halyomorpha halys]|uniref:uncharacterized protein n=1 Tax=Halyomorpha halys TaxID=286706 RepID=UPI0006D4F9C5|nr:uncharacterized protein LOC106688201 [Halyomorpha halys]
MCSAVKHPILLPRRAPLSSLIIDFIHSNHFHAGPALTLALLRGKYWIPTAAKLIRGRINRCVHCRIQRAKPIAPIMAPLPRARFEDIRPFVQTGVDYAGPFLIKESQRRNASLGKAYLCLFFCMSSKALHLELVSALTTTAFLACLDRFISRRGAPSTIWSDHGTNLVGASRFLKEIYRLRVKNQTAVTNNLALSGVEWKFIPPRAPHFGGLWEAVIKSVKRLLSSSVGSQPFTFEELATAPECLHTLQQQQKWTKKNPTPDVGDLVILLEKRSLVGQWPVARVSKAFPGRDGVTHTLMVRTPSGLKGHGGQSVHQA